MPTLTLTVDERTNDQLTRLSAGEGVPANEMAVRLLRRALRAKRPKPLWDSEAIRSHAASFAEEDARLAESDLPHRAALLLNEDNAEESDGFVGVIDTNTLMQRPGGAVWWKANGYQVRGEFDLSSNSPMSQLLADYLDENQVVVI